MLDPTSIKENHLEASKKNLLVFGYGVAVILSAVWCIRFFIFDRGLSPILLASIAFIGLWTTIAPFSLRPIFNVWMKLARFIGMVNTYLILFLLYFFILTPIAIVLRLFGGSPLPIKFREDVDSYWIVRDYKFEKKNYQREF